MWNAAAITAVRTRSTRFTESIPGCGTQFPNAQVTAASLTDIANAVEPYRERLPVVTQEIGDTWISGVPSDPLKVARYMEVARLRSEWLASGEVPGGRRHRSRLPGGLLLEVEHTWGADIKTWLDFDHYLPRDLQPMLDQPKYKVVLFSWAEKRQDLLDGVATLPAPLRAEATAHIHALDPVEPATAGMQPHRAADPIETKHFEHCARSANRRDSQVAQARRPATIGLPPSGRWRCFPIRRCRRSISTASLPTIW